MRYRTHELKVNGRINRIELETVLNRMEGKVIAVIPNAVPMFHLMGATATIDSLVIIEELGQ